MQEHRASELRAAVDVVLGRAVSWLSENGDLVRIIGRDFRTGELEVELDLLRQQEAAAEGALGTAVAQLVEFLPEYVKHASRRARADEHEEELLRLAKLYLVARAEDDEGGTR